MTDSNLTYKERTHLETLKSALLPSHVIDSDAAWIVAHTRLKQQPYSFKGHEYQEVVASDTARVRVILKCSQIGITELSLRTSLAFTQRFPGTKVIVVFPTITLGQNISKTRFSGIIDESPDLEGCLKPGNDSSTLKVFRNNSQIFFRGGSSGSSAISIDGDFIIADEVDYFSDNTILSQYESRLIHSPHKRKLSLSTPTLPGRGISDMFDKSMQFVELTKCNRCNHHFKPDYFSHVMLPGFNIERKYKAAKTQSLSYFNYSTRSQVDKYDLSKAYLACPKCGRAVDTSVAYREWVCVNPDSNIESHGYAITPFSCPDFINLGDLIRSSTAYKSCNIFVNDRLGVASDSSENSLTLEELNEMFKSPESQNPPYSVAGLDLGGTCYITIAVPLSDMSGFRVVHTEGIPLIDLETRYFELVREFRIVCTVSDSMPYTNDIIRMQRRDPNLWGALFSQRKDLELWRVSEVEEDRSKATFGMKAVSISRDKTLDFVVDLIRRGLITYNESDSKSKIILHLRDLKRSKKIDKYGDEVYMWSKSAAGDDHLFFSLMYCVVALNLCGTSSGVAPLPVLLSSISVKNN